MGHTQQNKAVKEYLDRADVFILVLGNDQKVKLVNQKGCQILGLPEKEIVGRNWFDNFLPEEIREPVRQTFFRIIDGQIEQVEFYENPVVTSSGKERLIAWRNSIFRDSEGKVLEILSTGEDITVRRQTENALRESEATLRAILETCVDGIITIDEEGEITSFNPAAVRIFGYRPNEVVGRDVGMLMPEPDSALHPGYINRFLKSQKARIIGMGREVVGRKKDGSHFPLYLAVSDVSVAGKRMFTGIVRDLTEFKEMQNEIIQAQKLAAIGEMAASVGHEIKNPLAGISGAIEILKDTLPKGDPRIQVMDDILSEVQRLDNTVRDLLAFSRPWNPDAQSCNLQELVERVARSFQEQEDLRGINFEMGHGICRNVKVDPWLFEKVLRNVLDNAADAMSGKGEIRFHFLQTPGFVTLTIEDTGEGVPEKHLGDVFRPFFTTKSRGTGLGLAICKKIMDAHNGSISLVSLPEEGTKVSLQLPVAESRVMK
jgi:two-component system sensor kinase FixL